MRRRGLGRGKGLRPSCRPADDPRYARRLAPRSRGPRTTRESRSRRSATGTAPCKRSATHPPRSVLRAHVARLQPLPPSRGLRRHECGRHRSFLEEGQAPGPTAPSSGNECLRVDNDNIMGLQSSQCPSYCGPQGTECVSRMGRLHTTSTARRSGGLQDEGRAAPAIWDWLGDRDSNPDSMVQSHVSYRWTISQAGNLDRSPKTCGFSNLPYNPPCSAAPPERQRPSSSAPSS